MKKTFEQADELDGFEELNEADQARVTAAWEAGHVAEEDVPESARKPEKETGEEGSEEDDGEEKEKKPKKKAAKKEKAKKEDKEDKPGVYKFEYASSGRAKCKGTYAKVVLDRDG